VGTSFLRYWAERFAFPHRDKFGVHDANEATGRTLVTLGYATKTERGSRGLRCWFFR
jgi:hypothetical protein